VAASSYQYAAVLSLLCYGFRRVSASVIRRYLCLLQLLGPPLPPSASSTTSNASIACPPPRITSSHLFPRPRGPSTPGSGLGPQRVHKGRQLAQLRPYLLSGLLLGDQLHIKPHHLYQQGISPPPPPPTSTNSTAAAAPLSPASRPAANSAACSSRAPNHSAAR
jgi:hypothetical protein